MATTRNKSTKTHSVSTREATQKSSPRVPNQEALCVAIGLINGLVGVAQGNTPLIRATHLTQIFTTLGLEEPASLTTQLIHLYLVGEYFNEDSQETDNRLYEMEKLRRKLTDLRHNLSPFQNQEGMGSAQANWLHARYDLVSAACLLCVQLTLTSVTHKDLVNAYTDGVAISLAQANGHMCALTE